MDSVVSAETVKEAKPEINTKKRKRSQDVVEVVKKSKHEI